MSWKRTGVIVTLLMCGALVRCGGESSGDGLPADAAPDVAVPGDDAVSDVPDGSAAGVDGAAGDATSPVDGALADARADAAADSSADDAAGPDSGDVADDAAPDSADGPDDATPDSADGPDDATPDSTDAPDAACPAPPEGCDGLHVATDLDGDGCPDACCVVECPPDFVASDFDGDGCGDSCGDAPCEAASDCSIYHCAFYPGQCAAPKGICSDFACDPSGPVCGCDGVTYESGCAANAAGAPVAKDGACEDPICEQPTSSSTLDGVSISTTAMTQCTFTLAEVAAGVEIPYAILVSDDVPGVVVEPGDAGNCAQPGPGGLIVFEKLEGGGQTYCICDQGLCAPPDDTPVTLSAGTYVTAFAWDGTNWFGPSDTGNPKGPAFPPGKYTLTLTAKGKAQGQPFEVQATLPVTLLP